ncbi:MAG: PilZ domain-containing protein [Lachnospiraceae bacterium]|nr:PilZ domain-containing protein [Lachnospiraceae bacterium]
MEERRKNQRMGLTAKILIKRMDQGGFSDEVNIEITDVSKTGVGFICDAGLEVGAVYESFLTIWTKEVLHAFMEIVRVDPGENGMYVYGAIFIGMTEIDASRIETYSTIENMDV